jgi:bifunctional non-homologous end joining protein LigD
MLDPSRNGPGATIVAPYSPRARPDATVSFPVVAKELRTINPADFNLTTVPRLLRRKGPKSWNEAARGKPERLPLSLLRD